MQSQQKRKLNQATNKKPEIDYSGFICYSVPLLTF